MNCAVIGANGFLGSNLVDKLVNLNYEVTAVYNSNSNNLNSSATQSSISEFLEKENSFDTIFISIGNYACSHSTLVTLNHLIGKILQKHIESKIIFISSTNVYGLHDKIISLDAPFNRPNLYALSKLAAEFEIAAHPKFLNFRFTYLYGKGLNNNSFLPNCIKAAKELGEITLFGDGSRKQDYLHVQDAVDLCIQGMQSEVNGTFIGASGTSLSNVEIANLICSELNSKIIFKGQESSSSFYFDISSTLTNFEWMPKVDWKKGIVEMI